MTLAMMLWQWSIECDGVFSMDERTVEIYRYLLNRESIAKNLNFADCIMN